MANLFDDPHCQAVWRFEPGALAVDSLGKCPDLSLWGAPASDPLNFIEGSGSAKLTLTPYLGFFYLTDSQLPANFPLKVGGGKILTWTGWYRSDADDPSGAWHLGKVGSLEFMISNASSHGAIRWYYDSSNYETFDLGWSPPAANRWYFFAIRADGDAQTLSVYIYGLTEAAAVVDADFSPVHALYLRDNYWQVGGSTRGNADEVVVFSRILADEEIDQIRAGTYGQISNICVTHCPDLTDRVMASGHCVTHCPDLTDFILTTGHCVTHCPDFRLSNGNMFIVF